MGNVIKFIGCALTVSALHIYGVIGFILSAVIVGTVIHFIEKE